LKQHRKTIEQGSDMKAHEPGATTWTPTDLATIDRTGEVEVATRRADGTLRTARIVWIVRHGDALYVRSVNGRDAAWYRGMQTRHAGVVTVGPVSHNVTFTEAGDQTGNETGLDHSLDDAYRAKCGRSSGAVERITAEQARATTLRLDPT
jgi:hypothetical protein